MMAGTPAAHPRHAAVPMVRNIRCQTEPSAAECGVDDGVVERQRYSRRQNRQQERNGRPAVQISGNQRHHRLSEKPKMRNVDMDPSRKNLAATNRHQLNWRLAPQRSNRPAYYLVGGPCRLWNGAAAVTRRCGISCLAPQAPLASYRKRQRPRSARRPRLPLCGYAVIYPGGPQPGSPTASRYSGCSGAHWTGHQGANGLLRKPPARSARWGTRHLQAAAVPIRCGLRDGRPRLVGRDRR